VPELFIQILIDDARLHIGQAAINLAAEVPTKLIIFIHVWHYNASRLAVWWWGEPATARLAATVSLQAVKTRIYGSMDPGRLHGLPSDTVGVGLEGVWEIQLPIAHHIGDSLGGGLKQCFNPKTSEY